MVVPLIHIGYQKTGSTWLRSYLYSNEQAGFVSPYSREQLLDNLVFPDALDFNAKVCWEYFRPGVQPIINQGLCPVLSLERLAGSPLSGGYDAREIADRLSRVFPQVKILIVIREQNSMILSSYRQYIKAGGPSSLLEYINPPGTRRIPLFRLDYYKYHRLIQYYYQLFGASNVLVLPFELFRKKPQEFVKKIFTCIYPDKTDFQFLEHLPYSEKANEGYSAVEIAAKRRISLLFGAHDPINQNSLFPMPFVEKALFYGAQKLGLFKLIPRSIKSALDGRLKSQVAEITAEMYAESNYIVSQLTHLDLSSLGYKVSQPADQESAAAERL